MTDWTDERLSFLRECAGEMHPYELAAWLEMTPTQVKRKAAELGLSVEYYERRTKYCVECSTYRLHDENGECPVCRARHQLAVLEAEESSLERRIAELGICFDGNELPPLNFPRPRQGRPLDASAAEHERADDEHDAALQEWELRRIRAAKDRVKQRNHRMRKAIAAEKARAAQ